MSDSIHAEIAIGGNVPRALYRQLVKELKNTYGALYAGVEDYDEMFWGPILCLEKCLDDGEHIGLYDGEARAGAFRLLEQFLARNNIPFDRHTDATYESLPAWRAWRPVRDWLLTCDTNGTPVVSRGMVETARSLLALGDSGPALQILNKLCEQPEPLPPFRIV